MTNSPLPLAGYQTKELRSARDMLLFATESAMQRAEETLADITEAEYVWEPIPEAERSYDRELTADVKRIWRIFSANGRYYYDYAPRAADNPAFTTIAWIMTHTAVTGDMYLHCVKTGKATGEEITWEDLPVYDTLTETREHVFQCLRDTREFLANITDDQVNAVLHSLTPAPWGELRPTFLNLWGGIIEHTIQHMMQVAVRKERIRQQF